MGNVTVRLELPDDEVWQRVLGSGWETWGWWRAVDWRGWAWDNPGQIEVTVLDPAGDEEDDTLDFLVTVEGIAAAVGKAPTWIQAAFIEDNLDAVGGDCIMQLATMQDIVYG